MKTKLSLVLSLVLLISGITAITGCNKQEDVSWSTQEQSRQQALDNSNFNSKVWRDANKPELKVMSRGDSTIGAKCATGDGWASVDLVNDSGVPVVKLKCSTVSGTIGCMTDADFKSRAQYANEDGTCNNNIPFPLPKIAK